MTSLVERLRDADHESYCSIDLDDTPACDCIVITLREAADRIEALEKRAGVVSEDDPHLGLEP